MSYTEILNTLSTQLDNAVDNQLLSMEKPFVAAKENQKKLEMQIKGKVVDYQNGINFNDMTPLAAWLYNALQNGADQYLLTRSKQCLELEILDVLTRFKVPMDLVIENNIVMADLIKELIEKANNYFWTDQKITAMDCINTLNMLTKIDLEASSELQQQSQTLIQHAITKGYAKCQNGNVHHLINILYYNSLYDMNSNKNYIPKDDIEISLKKIYSNYKGEFTAVHARQLLQLYMIHRDIFPEELYNKIKDHIEKFKDQTHGSTFEDKVKENLKGHHNSPIVNLKKDYEIMNQIFFDTENPLDKETGIESDFLITHPATHKKVSIQIDGAEYHRYPSMNVINSREDIKTKFRDFCLDKMGYTLIKITDAKVAESSYHLTFEDDMLKRFIIPVHQEFQQKNADAMKSKITDLTNQINTQLNELTSYVSNSSLDGAKTIAGLIKDNLREAKQIKLEIEEAKKAHSIIATKLNVKLDKSHMSSNTQFNVEVYENELKKNMKHIKKLIVLKSDAQKIITNLKKIQPDLSSLDDILKKFEDQYTDIVNKYAANENKRASFEQNKRGKIKDVEAEISTAESETIVNSDNIEKSEINLKKLQLVDKDKILPNEQDMNSLNDRLDALRKNILKSQNKLNAAKLKTKAKSFKHLKQNEKKKVELDIKEVENNITDENEEITLTMQKIEALKASVIHQYNHKIAEVAKEIGDLKVEANTLSSKLENLNDERTNLINQDSALKIERSKIITVLKKESPGKELIDDFTKEAAGIFKILKTNIEESKHIKNENIDQSYSELKGLEQTSNESLNNLKSDLKNANRLTLTLLASKAKILEDTQEKNQLDYKNLNLTESPSNLDNIKKKFIHSTKSDFEQIIEMIENEEKLLKLHDRKIKILKELSEYRSKISDKDPAGELSTAIVNCSSDDNLSVLEKQSSLFLGLQDRATELMKKLVAYYGDVGTACNERVAIVGLKNYSLSAEDLLKVLKKEEKNLVSIEQIAKRKMLSPGYNSSREDSDKLNKNPINKSQEKQEIKTKSKKKPGHDRTRSL